MEWKKAAERPIIETPRRTFPAGRLQVVEYWAYPKIK
jgi:hypothetical protein